jgi:phage FluMu protein Com
MKKTLAELRPNYSVFCPYCKKINNYSSFDNLGEKLTGALRNGLCDIEIRTSCRQCNHVITIEAIQIW